MSKQTEVSYLDWMPVMKASEVFQQAVSFSFLSVDEKGRLFWVEQRPEESGRSVLVMRDLHGEIRDVTPKPFSTRSRVFEYGGYSYTAFQDWAYFVNLSDQRIYKVNIVNPGPPVPLTSSKNHDQTLGKYLDLSVSPDGHWLIFAYEVEEQSKEARNEVGVIDLTINSEDQEAKILVTGASFYKSPMFSPDGKSVAWLEWNHPYMPWDSTRLFLAPFSNGQIDHTKRTLVAGSDNSSISGVCFSSDGELVYAQDFAEKAANSPDNFYNLYGYLNKNHRVITQELRDFQQIRCNRKTVSAYSSRNGESIISHVDLVTSKLTDLKFSFVDFSVPIPFDNKMYFIAVSATSPSQLVEVLNEGQVNTIKASSASNLDLEDISEGQAISFPTTDGQKSYGYFYPPRNSKHKVPANEKPPVRVMVHGGPTGAARPGFSKQKIYWTSQGYAIFDVNYRGSTGFGRKYRDALLKQWGILEIQDVKDGLADLKRRGLISDKAVVSGGSAGGYTVQRLLTFYPDLFTAGASYFGIGNLVTLQKLTHKFESHYLEQLIGGTLTTNFHEYENRSPINHLDKLKSPMIIFQGSEDKVVPPENSREMATILNKKGIHNEYYEYSNEDHGFSKSENLIDSLEKESQFFKSALKN